MKKYSNTFSPAYRIVAFDLGNVMLHVDINGFIDFMSEHFQIDRDRALTILTFIQPLQDIGAVDIVTGLKPFFPYGDYDLVREKWRGIISRCDPTISIMKELVDSGWADVCILSNIGHDHSRLVREMIPEMGGTSQYFSCEMGVRKPNTSYFKMFDLDKNLSKNSRNIFFDDRKDNIETADMFFQNTVCFDIEKYQTTRAAADDMGRIIWPK
jgi:FMN phosphatase YigB (HAD superfamily)